MQELYHNEIKHVGELSEEATKSNAKTNIVRIYNVIM